MDPASSFAPVTLQRGHRLLRSRLQIGVWLVALAVPVLMLPAASAAPDQQAYIKASNTGIQDRFGARVTLSGGTMAIGAPYEDSNSGGVNGNPDDESGQDAGAAYVYVRSGSNWVQQAYVKASNPGTDHRFGACIAISGDLMVVGAAGENSSATGVNGEQGAHSAPNAGAAYVFTRDGTNWVQQAYLKASNTRAGDQFGFSVAASGDTLVVGSPGESGNATGVNADQSNLTGTNSGAAYVFVRHGQDWEQEAYLKASNTGGHPLAGDRFGWSVAVSGDTAVVGAPVESSSATGVNGDQTDNCSQSAGAAYVFVRRGTHWFQQAYLKASNSEAWDFFGVSVAVFEGDVVVGAEDEGSDAIGVNGDQSNDNQPGSGAGYVFTGFCSACPQLTIVPDGAGGYFIRFSGGPDVAYRVQRAASLSGPWDTRATVTTPASGILEFHDTNAPPAQAFYRTAQP